MIARVLDRLLSRQVRPATAGTLFFILAISPELKWRLRDPSASVSATADLQTLFELAWYVAIGAWAVWHLARNWSNARYNPRTLGPATTLLCLAALLVVTTGATALSMRALTRSAQYAVMLALILVVWWEARQRPDFFDGFWMIMRRGFVAFALFATVVTAVVPSFDGSVDDAGIRRYGWLEIHPITTAGLLGVALLAILGLYLGRKDPLVLTRRLRLGSLMVAVLLTGLLVLTKSRGATAAVAASVMVLIALSPRGRNRKIAGLGLVLAVGLALAYFTTEGGADQLAGFVTRGQTTEQVLSLSQRTTLFEIGMTYVEERPIFGHGYMIPGTLLRTHFAWAGHAHNVVLELLMGVGYVGLAVFAVLIAVVARGLQVGRSAKARSAELMAEGAALLTLILVQGVISDGFAGPVGWEVAVLMLTVVISDLGRHRAAVGPASGLPTQPAEPLPPSPTDTLGRLPVDINTGSVEDLRTIPGVGAELAARIVQRRADHGPFADVDELLSVKGIGRSKLARLRPLLTASHHELRFRRW